MGYTHYWYRKPEIDVKKFSAIVADFKKMISPLADLGVHLADGHGDKEAIINNNNVIFNGPNACGHPKDSEISIPWPSKDAGGVAKYGEKTKVKNWFAGAIIDKRCCDGNCSYETLMFPRIVDLAYRSQPITHTKRKDLHFECTKTAYRPYDLAVNVFLIIAKHHLGEELIVASDGEMVHWQEGMMLCQVHIGYGLEFKLPRGE